MRTKSVRANIHSGLPQQIMRWLLHQERLLPLHCSGLHSPRTDPFFVPHALSIMQRVIYHEKQEGKEIKE
jgi:hypothetical protein